MSKSKTKRSSSARPRASRKRESVASRRERAEWVIARLKPLYPKAECALHHNSALQLLAATILSAQCTDERVNMVTPQLFTKYPTAKALADADQSELETIVRSTGFYRNKAKNLIGMGKVVTEKFGGQVPDQMDDLLQLPGVARKTANVLLGTWFGRNDGFVVDTHIGRLATRLSLTWRSRDDKDAVKIERDLMEVTPQDEWTWLGHAFIWHGRKVCTARKPDCAHCVLNERCPSAKVPSE